MLGQAGKGEIKLQCKEQSFPEFPNLLFGQSESGRSYFDATHYLSKMTERVSFLFKRKSRWNVLLNKKALRA